MKRTTLSLLFLLFIVVNALAEVINITVKGTTDKASKEVILNMLILFPCPRTASLCCCGYGDRCATEGCQGAMGQEP